MINRWIKLSLLTCLTLGNAIVFGQNQKLKFRRLGSNDGLASNLVNRVFQDSNGFIWIGTDDGLCKYDGLRFTNYKTRKSDPQSLKANGIDAILEDQGGNLIIGTSKGLCQFNMDQDNFTNVSGMDPNASLHFTNIEDAIIDKSGSIWVSVEQEGIYSISPDRKKIEHYQYDSVDVNSLISNQISFIHEDANGNIWFTSRKGLSFFDPLQNNFINFSTFIAGDESTSFQSLRIAENQNGSLFIGSTGGLLIVDINDPTRLRPLTTKDPILNEYLKLETTGLFVDKDDNLWFGAGGKGLIRLSSDLKSFNLLQHESTDIFSLSNNAINTIFQDNAGDMWINTVSGGLNIIHFTNQAITHYKNVPGNMRSLTNNKVSQFAEDKFGRIWIATDGGGINLFDPSSGRFLDTRVINERLGHDGFLGLAYHEGFLYAGTWGKGFFQIEPISGEIKNFMSDNSKLSSNNIFDFELSNNESMWLATHFGSLASFDISKRLVRDLQLPAQILEDRDLVVIKEDNRGSLVFGGYTGLHDYNPSNFEYKKYTQGDSVSNISNNFIYAILLEADTIAWIGTRDGLNRLNRKKGIFEKFYEEDGLPSNSVNSIVSGKDGDLWISTNNGISLFNYAERTFQNFTIKDGLQDRQFNKNSAYSASDGALYFGGVNGFNIIQPDKIVKNDFIPPVQLTDFKIQGKSVVPSPKNSPLSKHISKTSSIVLEYTQRFFAFTFIGLNYISADKNRYKYRLEGFDEDWVNAENVLSASYTNVPPGTYKFQVVSSNNDGIWNQKGATVNIKVLPPWWQTWWFRIFLIGTLFGLFGLIYQLRTKELKNQKELLAKLVKERTTELENVTTTLKDKQEYILSQNHKLLEQKDELQAALENLQSTQTQLIQAEKMASLGTLTAGIAHEINNPLNYIKGGAKIIEEYLNKNSDGHLQKMKPNLQIIEQGIQRATSIVNSLNRFNRSTEERNESCDMHVILDNCLTMLHHLLKQRIVVNKNYRSESFLVNGNEGELHQAVLNILTNAIQAIEKNGEIEISTKNEKGSKMIVISDTGKGIGENNLGKIADPFFTTKPPGEGTGLGLSITYSILKKHNAEINYSSQVGEGTEVTISFK